jgi:hypothetical protein
MCAPAHAVQKALTDLALGLRIARVLRTAGPTTLTQSEASPSVWFEPLHVSGAVHGASRLGCGLQLWPDHACTARPLQCTVATRGERARATTERLRKALTPCAVSTHRTRGHRARRHRLRDRRQLRALRLQGRRFLRDLNLRQPEHENAKRSAARVCATMAHASAPLMALASETHACATQRAMRESKHRPHTTSSFGTTFDVPTRSAQRAKPRTNQTCD